MLHEGVDAGGLGIGVPLDYFSEAVDRDELRMVFEVAGERKVPLFITCGAASMAIPPAFARRSSLQKRRAPPSTSVISHMTPCGTPRSSLPRSALHERRESTSPPKSCPTTRAPPGTGLECLGRRLLNRMFSIGGAENAAYIAYPQRVHDRDLEKEIRKPYRQMSRRS
jgi:hypothetical protein